MKKEIALLSVSGSIASILGVVIALSMHCMMDCILNSPPFWTFVAVFFTGTAITPNGPRIRRLSKTVRFVESRRLTDQILAELPSRGAIFSDFMRSHSYDKVRNDIRQLRREMTNFDVRIPALLNAENLDTWRAFITDLLDCTNAKDLKRARTLLDRYR